VAISGLVSGLMTASLLSHGVSIPSLGPTLATLIALGVGVDYALFIVTRHRANLKAGMPPAEAAARALNTAGRAVLFAGITVCLALTGLLVLRLNYLSGLGIAATIAVLFTMAAAVTLLPALLGFCGTRVLSRKERRRLAGRRTLARCTTRLAVLFRIRSESVSSLTARAMISAPTIETKAAIASSVPRDELFSRISSARYSSECLNSRVKESRTLRGCRAISLPMAAITQP